MPVLESVKQNLLNGRDLGFRTWGEFFL